ncbi:MFS transporter [Leptospira alstonii]|uniref:Transporter, major facilitator family protein n=2 Tax=Leptospira alstonii TaxID=28452 RepID=M6D3C9_9LEPT|nr:MFS transporter [Leptospira alstonii]EMJ95728.1 transporter, major facilitator family protein [Leptospira alstonii serovar Sichuan str. 79601]EQA80702.1 transporter, major facilitator family protein [Leptospira alstonii serovar Pingchang str. 80-412]
MKFSFTKYQGFVVALLAFIQFTVVLDFMILSPLGVQVMENLKISTEEFGLVVSVYAFSAGASGILSAGFADRFDRKKILLFFYVGFVIGTALCGLAFTYQALLIARIVTGLFGGVIASISFAIIADLFPFEVRGRVMGIVMTAFAASQVFGLPLGIFISTHWGWQSPFLWITCVSAFVGIGIIFYLKPIITHLKTADQKKAFKHLIQTAIKPIYLPGFLATTFLATGGFMLMPFGSAFTVHNLGIPLEDLPEIYIATGIASIATGPLMGRLSDAIGKYVVFTGASVMAIAIVLYYTRLENISLLFVISINCLLFIQITARMIAANALTSSIPDLQDRGAFMAICSSLQQISGGIAAYCAGLIVVQTSSGYLKGYENLGYVVSIAILLTIAIMYRVDLFVRKKSAVVPQETFSVNGDASLKN